MIEFKGMLNKAQAIRVTQTIGKTERELQKSGGGNYSRWYYEQYHPQTMPLLSVRERMRTFYRVMVEPIEEI